MYRRSLMLTAPYQLQWMEERLSSLKSNEILVRTLAGAISIGTELPIYQGLHRGSTPIKYPKMTGYESYAEVIECGDHVKDFVVGQRIIAFYGHRTHAILPIAKAIPVPNDITPDFALLVILGCDVTNGINKLEVENDAEILITGAGTIGLLTLFNLLHRGFNQIDVVEPFAERRRLAEEMGARKAIAPSQLDVVTAKYEAGFECSSRNEAFELMQKSMQPGGQISVLADGNLEPLILLPDFHEKELKIFGSSDGEDYQGYAKQFWEMVHSAEFDLSRLYEKKISKRQLSDCFRELADGQERPIKVFVDYSD